MNMSRSEWEASTVDEYIQFQSEAMQPILQKVRQTIKNTAPNATESMAYNMPAYKLDGKPLVYFAAFAKHVGFYATPAVHESFAKELSKYKQGKGSVQFPLDQQMPYELIAAMTKYKAAEIVR